MASHVEHDFLGIEKANTSSNNNNNNNNNSSSASSLGHPRSLDRRQSFRGISKINPEIVKSVMASAAKAENASMTVPIPDFQKLAVFRPSPLSRASNSESEKEKGKEEDATTDSMTIFYNGTVSVFDLPKDKADCVINFVMEKTSRMNKKTDNQVDEASLNAQNDTILYSLNHGDLPIKRKKSLHRFFEKRKERLISVSPYLNNHVSTITKLPNNASPN